MGPTLADRLRDTARQCPRRQATTLYALAAEAARMEDFLNTLVEDALDDVRALEYIRAAGHG